MMLPTPWIPDGDSRRHLLDRCSTVIARSDLLRNSVPIGIREALSPLLRNMNSYYSNLIEGQHTTPAEIELALNSEFSEDSETARRQRLAIAHVEIERELRLAFRSPYEAPLLLELHRRLFEAIEPEIQPGEFRTVDVQVGNHIAPSKEDVPGLIEHWCTAYSHAAGRDERLLAGICAHHRLAWIHPFRDGNGRVSRLQLLMSFNAVDLTGEIWSPLRGFARDLNAYYVRLANADWVRKQDVDGRGNLTQRGLIEWCDHVLGVCEDQMLFMEQRIDIASFKQNVAALLMWYDAHPWNIGSERSLIKIEVLEPLHYLAMVGELDRQKFLSMTGLRERTARRVLATLLDIGIVKAASVRAPLRFALPSTSLRFLFPGLWPEA